MSHQNKSKLEEYKRFYENEQIVEQGFLLNGRFEGEHKFWYENGQLWVQNFCRNGHSEGMRNTWYLNGKIMDRAHYQNRKLQGKYRFWYSDGSISMRRFYRDGILTVAYFSGKTNRKILYLKRLVRNRVNLENLISDLAKIACSYR